MEKPSVSVVIPNYNHAPFLRERIDSVLAQDYTDFEVILLDDCSTDDSRDIIRSYEGHPHVSQIVLNSKNSGTPFAQWAKGISLAKGEMVWIAESDDVADPQLLGTLMAELKLHERAAVAFVHSRLIDQEGHQLPYGWHDEDTGEVRVSQGRQFVISKMLTSNYIYNASMAVFRKSAFARIGRGYMEYRYCGDWAFWAELCLQGEVIEVGRVLNSYRQHVGMTTKQSLTTGGKWIEVGDILKSLSTLLHLTGWQHRCLRGRYTKRFAREDVPNRDAILARHADLFGASQFDICCYELGKVFGFL